MSYLPHTEFAFGLHPMTKPPKVKAPRKSRQKSRVRIAFKVEYKLITAHEVTKYLTEHPGSTMPDVQRALGASTFNTDRMLRRLRAGHKINRTRETDHSLWRYYANAIAPKNSDHVAAIKKCLAEHPDIPATEVLQRTGVTDVLCKLKELRKRGVVLAVKKMTPNFGRPVKHYSLRVAA